MAGSFQNIKSKLPILGVGLGLRRELAQSIFDNQSSIDWLELVPENFMGLGGRAERLLKQAKKQFPLVSHGINLSLGSADELNMEYLSALKSFMDYIDAPWFSDHLCFSSVDGVYMHDLLPLPLNKEVVEHVAQRIRFVQDFIGRPLLIENISFYMQMPGSQMFEAEFLTRILEEADCGLLLDVNNVYVNSINHGFSPQIFLDAIPLERTVQIHVAGHKHIDEHLIDTHGESVIQPVYDLLEYVLSKVSVNAVMLERDQNFPPFSEILEELSAIRKLWNTDLNKSTMKKGGNYAAIPS
jgi:uncharacterized protein (UPF0276 family)